VKPPPIEWVSKMFLLFLLTLGTSGGPERLHVMPSWPSMGKRPGPGVRGKMPYDTRLGIAWSHKNWV
jgi:hypothetical protein